MPHTATPYHVLILAACLAAAPTLAPAAEAIADPSADALQTQGMDETEVILVRGQPFERALKVVVPAKSDTVWDYQVRTAPIGAAVRKGDRLAGEFYVRSDTAGATAAAMLERGQPTWEGLAYLNLKPGKAWEKVTFDVTAEKDYEAGSLAFVFHLGHAAQTVEIGGLRIENLDAEAEPAAEVTSGPADLSKTSAAYQAMIEEQAAALPGEPRLILVADPAAYDAPGTAGQVSEARAELVDADGQPFGQAVRVELDKAQGQPWGAYIKTPVTFGDIKAGDVLFGSYFVRGSADDESGTGEFKGYLQRETGTWAQVATSSATPGDTWSRRTFKATANADFPAGTVNFVFQMGGKAQELEVGGFALWNLGDTATFDELPVSRVSYAGQEPDAPWRAEAEARIEEIRKGDLTVKVVDAAGEPVEGATVDVELTDHEFGFGTWLGIYGPLFDEGENGENFRRITRDYFNRVTTAVYPAETWGWPDPETRERNLKSMKWATDEGFDTRAHVILWSSWDRLPQSFVDLKDDPVALNDEVNRYVREVMGTIKQFPLDEVDFQNETRSNHDIEDAIGQGEEVRIEWWKTAMEVAPDLPLAVNEFGIVSDRGTNESNIETYEDDIRLLIDNGVDVAVIGVQGHIGEDFTTPEQLYKVFDRLSAFGLPIQVTEFDVETTDTLTQADYLRDFYTVAFSHPSVEAVTMWGFWEADHWKPNAALWTDTWQAKPAAEQYVELMTETWHTDETLTTGPDGTAEVRGFRGEYVVNVTHGGKTAEAEVTLDDDETLTVRLK